ncbi:MAG: CCA tRNA nucleotidyltransferase [Peptostreptococcus sp.]|uniref:CCA tRNA nucleotidyltransferase n=1 Tax=Peptostreptococcus sp. TaxID=1262 RepID=UPI002FC7AC70
MKNIDRKELALEIDSGASFIIETLEKYGFEGFVVGGCVRDSIMKRKPNDWDITTNATPKEMMNIFDRTIPTGVEHGTVTIMKDHIGYEATTYRIDGKYLDMRHPSDVIFSENIIDDLSRRDFTINAMAYNNKVGLIDSFNGVEDIKKKLIRCVGDPDQRFNEDALRMVRAIRFSAKLGFEIEEKTFSSILRNSKNVENISIERINKELEEIIEYNSSKLEYFNTVKLSKWLFNGYILDRENLDNAYRLDSFIDDHQFCKYLDSEDQEKKYKQALKRALIFEEISKEELNKIMRNLRYSKKEIEYTISIHSILKDEKYELLTENTSSDADKKLLLKYILRDLNNIYLVKYAIYSKFIEKNTNPSICFMLFNDIIELGECFSISQLKLNGRDIIKNDIASGAQVGKILSGLLEHVIHNPIDNEKDQLLSLARKA